MFGTNVVVEVVTTLLTAGNEKEETCGTNVIEVRPPVKVATPSEGRLDIVGGFAMLEYIETKDVIGEDAAGVTLVRILLWGLVSPTSTELLQEERCIFIHMV